MTESELEIVFIPSLVDMLSFAENDKGAPLTQEEVLQVRDNAVCITLRKHAAQKMEEARGYKDINLENCWQEWLEFRNNTRPG